MIELLFFSAVEPLLHPLHIVREEIEQLRVGVEFLPFRRAATDGKERFVSAQRAALRWERDALRTCGHIINDRRLRISLDAETAVEKDPRQRLRHRGVDRFGKGIFGTRKAAQRPHPTSMIPQRHSPGQPVDKAHAIRKWLERSHRVGEFVSYQLAILKLVRFGRTLNAFGLNLVGIHPVALDEKEDPRRFLGCRFQLAQKGSEEHAASTEGGTAEEGSPGNQVPVHGFVIKSVSEAKVEYAASNIGGLFA